jgi:diacylglycerol kinase family enzyme
MSAALRLLPPEPLAFETMAYEALTFEPLTRDRNEAVRDHPPAAPAPIRAGVVSVVINARAGRVRRMGRARAERAIRSGLGEALLDLHWAEPAQIETVLVAALAARPGVLAVLGGDGTARAALDAAGGLIPVAPLPGGTLNRLSRAVYGRAGLKACLTMLPTGAPRLLPAGRIGDDRFYAACGFGPLMELDGLRDDLRARRGLRAAWARLATLSPRAFREALTWSTPGRGDQAASTLVVALGPIDSAFGLAPPAPRLLLEVAGARLDGWPDLARLAIRVALGRWRSRCGPTVRRGGRVEVAGLAGPVFGLVDGERRLFPSRFTIEFEPAAALVWGPGEGSGSAAGFNRSAAPAGTT